MGLPHISRLLSTEDSLLHLPGVWLLGGQTSVGWDLAAFLVPSFVSTLGSL